MSSHTEAVSIVVAEDSPTQAEHLRHLLERQGFSVILARNGLEALVAIRTACPTLVISDILMPEMDGYELCRTIRAMPDRSDLPVVLLTQLDGSHDILNALECEADNFIPKPFNEEHFLVRIRSILEGLHGRRDLSRKEKSVVMMNGEQFQIYAAPQRTLDLLTSTYEATVARNRELQFTQRKLEEANLKLQRALNERDVLLKEIHHRVKNNLQMVSSILHLQELNPGTATIEEILHDCRDRIKTMANVHEQLYRSGDYAAIDLGASLKAIGAEVIKSHAHMEVTSRFDTDELYLEIDRAIPCGLLVTELLTNAFKHAFTGRQAGVLTVSLRRLKPDKAELTVSDDGVGLPDFFDIATAESTGMGLISTFIQQIDGDIRVERGVGTCFRIRFPVNAAQTAVVYRA